MIRLLLLLCVLVSPCIAKADTLEEAFSSLSLTPQITISGNFIQRKKIKILKNALISKGEFSAHASGFVWQQHTPVKSQIRMDEQGVFSLDHLGNEQALHGAEQYIPLLQGLLLQNPKLLSDFLTVETVEKNCLLLKTKPPINQIYQSVRLCGEGKVSQLVLHEQAGHLTKIDLNYVTSQ